jgi:ABC-type multidrug transport system ATPase subunit
VKDSVEISMKEGSSAGQRALASIIIRLALAEAFAGHCGALVLDEPTANLDIENTESLAISLGTYVSEYCISLFLLSDILRYFFILIKALSEIDVMNVQISNS